MNQRLDKSWLLAPASRFPSRPGSDFFDRARAMFLMVAVVSACATIIPPRSGPRTPADTIPRPNDAWISAEPSLLRGINLGNALEAPREGLWGVTLTETHFRAYAEAGFDHVRLPVKFSVHAADAAPYSLDGDFMERVDWAIGQALLNHLSIILDMHHYDELDRQPEEHADQFVAMWQQIATRYASLPRQVVLELMNEPHDKLTSEHYNPIIARTLAAVRAIDPKRLVVVDCVFWANADKLEELVVPTNDPNLIVSFHMYQPILFTHQGLAFMPSEYGTKGIVYPGPPKAPITPVPGALAVPWAAQWFDEYNQKPAAENPSGPKTIREQFDYATRFAERTKIRMYLGEMGVGDGADDASRSRWLRAVRDESEKRKIGWAYWDDGGRFKAFDVKQNSWNPAIRDALLR